MARPRPLGDLIDTCLGPALAAQGFAASDVIVAWPEIVGARFAAVTQPMRIDWPRRARMADPTARPEPAVLVVRVESAFALEMQHLAPVIIERVNAYYGWRCLGRMVLKQGPVRRDPRRTRAAPALAEEDRRHVAAVVAGVEEEGLRAALDRLGRAVVGDAGRTTPERP